MRICFVLPGLHRVNRGAETAFESVATELAKIDGCHVTLFGSGQPDVARKYDFVHVPSSSRERFRHFPRFPGMRSDCSWEELTFIPGLAANYNPKDFDISVTCSYPYTNWFLRGRRRKGYRPAHIYVTQNGDWPCQASNSEYRWFGCEGLICTNPEYFDRNEDMWNCRLIPNGVDPTRFCSGPGNRRQFGLPEDVPLILMVSALIPSKRVLEGIEAVSRTKATPHLVVAGDGPMRKEVAEYGKHKLSGRFLNLQLPREHMPELYRCADMFLHMSLDEPSANAYIEALSTGLPIVTHDRKVTRWTLEDCGIFADCLELQCVAGAIDRTFATLIEDRAARQQSLVLQRYTWQRIATQYLDLFQSVSAQRGKSATPAIQSNSSNDCVAF